MSGSVRRAGLVAAGALVLLSGCQVRPPWAASPTPTPVSARAPAEAPLGAPTVHLAAGASVFVVVMENRSSATALAQPYLADLAARYAVAANYRAVAHPSVPNYLALTSGSTYGIADDEYHALPATGIGRQLTVRGIRWRAYMEGMGSDCRADRGRYAVRHDPFAFYSGRCPSNVVSFATLESDLAGDTPRFVWITPDLCHDGHDCDTLAADDYLASLVPKILASPSWGSGGALFITWDEDDYSAANQVATVVVAPGLKAHQSSRPYDHYSLLATVEDLLALPRLGAAAQAQAMDDLLQ